MKIDPDLKSLMKAVKKAAKPVPAAVEDRRGKGAAMDAAHMKETETVSKPPDC